MQSTNSPPALPAKASQPTMANAQARRVLGEVSPNTKVGMSSSRPMMGSPLKRSFTAMAEDGTGFQYLRKRRMSGENVLSHIDPMEERRERQSPPIRVFTHVTADESERTCLDVSLDLVHDSARPIRQTIQADSAVHLSDCVQPSIPEIHEQSSTEPNTPSDQDEEEEGTQTSSLDRKSFSSLINYDATSSQTFRSRGPILPSTTSRAEMLRLRLRVAMYKVRTNQINIPFDQLAGFAAEPTATSRAVEEAVAQLRREAQWDLARRQDAAGKQTGGHLKLLPAPLLLPTAYSSRMVYEENAMPSSPPAGPSPARRGEDLQRHSSPAWRRDEANLTSSVVKGRVAEGLLGLRNAV